MLLCGRLVSNCSRQIFKSLPPASFKGAQRLSTSPPNNETTQNEDTKTLIVKPSESMSIAMKFYLERKREHDAFIAHERSEFELGKRHLANMMGISEAEMTQKDIDKSIEYLFPSGLSEPQARPQMRPPEDVYPRQKDPEFDVQGRPFHPFFYTTKPHFSRLLYDIVETIENCYRLNDRLISQGKFPDPGSMLTDAKLTSTRWLTREELSELLTEKITDAMYEEFLAAIKRLTFQHFSYKFEDFIFRYRKEAAVIKSKQDFMQPEFDDEGRASVEAIGQRNNACAKVRVTKPGTGKFTIRHIDYMDLVNDITYFFGFKERHQIMYPLQLTGLLGLVDVDAIVYNCGCASQAGAVRYATSLCLKSFVNEDMIDEMSVAGLLTQDVRVKERKKPGRSGARRRYAWNKR